MQQQQMKRMLILHPPNCSELRFNWTKTQYQSQTFCPIKVLGLSSADRQKIVVVISTLLVDEKSLLKDTTLHLLIHSSVCNLLKKSHQMIIINSFKMFKQKAAVNK